MELDEETGGEAVLVCVSSLVWSLVEATGEGRRWSFIQWGREPFVRLQLWEQVLCEWVSVGTAWRNRWE